MKRWLYTAITVLAIFYLTLVPRPLPPEVEFEIPGLDKVVHACMFGGLTLVFCLDLAYKRKRFRKLPLRTIVAVAIGSAMFGGAIEIAQNAMGVGRSGDNFDFVADAVGCVIAAFYVRYLLAYEVERR